MGLWYSGGAQLTSEMSLVLNSTSVALVQDFSPVAWGQDSTLWACPGGPVAKTPRSQGRGLGLEPWQGTRSHVPQRTVFIPQLKDPTCCS